MSTIPTILTSSPFTSQITKICLVILKLAKKLSLRQRVIATATIFFKRFYLKNSYCETDPFIVIAACCYVAAKAEESPVHIKNVVTEARIVFSQDIYGCKTFPSDNSKLAEMEFYLVDDLECDLVVFHPYRTLLTLCKKEGDSSQEEEEGEAGELGAGIGMDDGPKYWGSTKDQLQVKDGALQTAWFIINDTYRSDICLIYPPHMIAIAAIYMTFVFDKHSRASLPLFSSSPTAVEMTSQRGSQPEPSSQPRRSSRQASHASIPDSPKKPTDAIDFLAGLNVSLPLIATIIQDIISLYTLWERYKGEGAPPPERISPFNTLNLGIKRSQSHAGTPADGREGSIGSDTVVTPAFLSGLLLRMREAKLVDVAHPGNAGRPVAVNKMLERTQAAG
ncbi:hypothetical protein ONZ45_g10650 [Pleurotus djamor]|nr:hypothetical protein ONZ45_g10650 [Pleurotus djamor]